MAGTGTQQPMWDRLGELSHAGPGHHRRQDEKFTALGGRMAAAIGPNATHAVVAGAGHAPHLQRPHEVAGLVRAHMRVGRPTVTMAPLHGIQNQRETDSRAPKTNCRRPVAARTGSSARPEASLLTILTGATARGSGQQRGGRRGRAKGVDSAGDRHQAPDQHPAKGSTTHAT